jgi:hypothetical protein
VWADHAFPWRGEQVRMALPTSLPPTLGSWAAARAAGTTEGAKYDASVPRQGLQQVRALSAQQRARALSA